MGAVELEVGRCRPDEAGRILEIVNAAAEAYRGVIPADRWHDPYMPEPELAAEIAAGVAFWGCRSGGELVGIMGMQPVRDVILIRHAYVHPSRQRAGIGGVLLRRIREASDRRILVGTWAAADWAVAFYQRNGFRLVPRDLVAPLLRTYWTIPERQIETSVVLADPPLG